MSASLHRRSLQAVLVAGALYLVVGLLFAALARSAASDQGRAAWRLAAWVISAGVFSAQIVFEHLRLRNGPRTTAVYAALAVGLGAFGIASAATLHAHATQQHFPAFALAVWPVAMALPAFVVALLATAVLVRARRA